MPNPNVTEEQCVQLQQASQTANKLAQQTAAISAGACVGSLFPTPAAPALGAVCVLGGAAAVY